MSKRFKELFLFDILIAILKIEDYCYDIQDAQALKHDYKTWDIINNFLYLYKNEIYSNIEALQNDIKNKYVQELVKENSHICFVVEALAKLESK